MGNLILIIFDEFVNNNLAETSTVKDFCFSPNFVAMSVLTVG